MRIFPYPFSNIGKKVGGKPIGKQDNFLMPVDKEWEKLAKEVIVRLGITWDEWVWLIDKIGPAILARAKKK